MAALGRGGSSPLPRTTFPLFNLTFGSRPSALPNCWGCTVRYGRVAELVYATDLKSVESNLVRVQVPPRPPEII